MLSSRYRLQWCVTSAFVWVKDIVAQQFAGNLRLLYAWWKAQSQENQCSLSSSMTHCQTNFYGLCFSCVLSCAHKVSWLEGLFFTMTAGERLCQHLFSYNERKKRPCASEDCFFFSSENKEMCFLSCTLVQKQMSAYQTHPSSLDDIVLMCTTKNSHKSLQF